MNTGRVVSDVGTLVAALVAVLYVLGISVVIGLVLRGERRRGWWRRRP